MKATLHSFSELNDSAVQRRILGTKRPRTRIRKVEIVDLNDLNNRPANERVRLVKKEIGYRLVEVSVFYVRLFGEEYPIKESEVAEYRRNGAVIIERTTKVWRLDI